MWSSPLCMYTPSSFPGPFSLLPNLLLSQRGKHCIVILIFRFTVKKDGPNKGRKFFKCSKPEGSQCDFFKWADNTPTSNLPTRGGQRESGPTSPVSGQDQGSIPIQNYDPPQQPDISNHIQPHSTSLSGTLENEWEQEEGGGYLL